MNNNKTLITHMQTDPNAVKHATIGFGIFILVLVAGLIIFKELLIPLVCSLLLPYVAGVCIEILQRFQGGTNTTRESVMDILTTGSWFIYPFANR
jgi:predicted PurR-regulated permease PerM